MVPGKWDQIGLHRSAQFPPPSRRTDFPFTDTGTDTNLASPRPRQPPGPATWQTAINSAVLSIRRRTSGSEVKRVSPGDAREPESEERDAVSDQIAPHHPNISSSTAQTPPVDHLGRPLSDAALAVAREYWDCQRKLDSCPFDQEDAEASALPLDLVLQLSWHRRSYTQLLFGLNKLESGTRTYEPPYVQSLPFGLLLAPDQAPDATARPTSIPPNAPLPKPKTRPVLCPEQLEVVELAASGRNIFYTGSAGCGKSTVLHAIKARLREMGKEVRVMAPTGKVALAINGTTTW